jgi:SAM-dependent methyltransferase
MPRAGELTYYERIGERGREAACRKPFSEDRRGWSLMQVGAVLALLPPPPARVLDCGCGTGWLTHILARSGYHAVGVDVSPQAVALARAGDDERGPGEAQFLVADAEDLPFEGEFDAVVFFDALHHALDERRAVECAHRALRPGGVLVASEPGPGHAAAARAVSHRFDVTEKDMPPARVLALGHDVGFRSGRVYPRADDLGKHLYPRATAPCGWLARGLAYAQALALMLIRTRAHGVVVLTK